MSLHFFKLFTLCADLQRYLTKHSLRKQTKEAILQHYSVQKLCFITYRSLNFEHDTGKLKLRGYKSVHYLKIYFFKVNACV
jgi:hypothetical protein